MDKFPIKVESIKGRGRGLVATKDLKAGDTVLTEKPYAFCLSRSYNVGNRCDFCFIEKEKLFRCTQCKHQKYCTRSCQKSAWDLHKAECKKLPKLATENFKLVPEEILFFTRLLTKLQLEKKQGRQQGAKSDEFPQSINDLIDHYEHWELEYELGGERQRVIVQSFLEKKIKQQEFYRLASRVHSNALYITGPVKEELGPGIYLKASLINNSCDNNSIVVYVGTTLHVRARKTIMKGEEFTVSYVDVLQPTFIRQKILREQYFFNCKCTRCENKELDAELQSILCEKCSGQVLRKSDKTFIECSTCLQLPSQRHVSVVLAIEAESESFLKVQKGKPDTSDEPYFKHALEIARRQNDILHPLHYLRVKMSDKVYYIGCSLKKYHRILPFLVEVKSSYELLYPANEPLVGIYCGRMAAMYMHTGRIAEACGCFAQALEILKITHGESHFLYKETIDDHNRCVNLLRELAWCFCGNHW